MEIPQLELSHWNIANDMQQKYYQSSSNIHFFCNDKNLIVSSKYILTASFVNDIKYIIKAKDIAKCVTSVKYHEFVSSPNQYISSAKFNVLAHTCDTGTHLAISTLTWNRTHKVKVIAKDNLILQLKYSATLTNMFNTD